MKKILLSAIVFGIMILGLNSLAKAQCNDELAGKCMPDIGNYKFLKSFPVRLKETKKGAPLETVKFNVTLNQGVTYKIVACNASEFPGKAVISLNQGMKMLGTSYDATTKKHYPGIIYQATSSGIYSLSFYFEDGKEGCAVGIISQASK